MKLLDNKRKRIIERIQSSISSSNGLLSDINIELIEIVNENKDLVRAAEIYDMWIQKNNKI